MELKELIDLSNKAFKENNFKEVFYYITPLNIWNSNHHNGIPNIFENKDIPE